MISDTWGSLIGVAMAGVIPAMASTPEMNQVGELIVEYWHCFFSMKTGITLKNRHLLLVATHKG